MKKSKIDLMMIILWGVALGVLINDIDWGIGQYNNYKYNKYIEKENIYFNGYNDAMGDMYEREKGKDYRTLVCSRFEKHPEILSELKRLGLNCEKEIYVEEMNDILNQLGLTGCLDNEGYLRKECIERLYISGEGYFEGSEEVKQFKEGDWLIFTKDYQPFKKGDFVKIWKKKVGQDEILVVTQSNGYDRNVEDLGFKETVEIYDGLSIEDIKKYFDAGVVYIPSDVEGEAIYYNPTDLEKGRVLYLDFDEVNLEICEKKCSCKYFGSSLGDFSIYCFGIDCNTECYYYLKDYYKKLKR